MGIISKAKTSSKIQYSNENKIDEDVTLVNLKKTCNLINHAKQLPIQIAPRKHFVLAKD
jgi:hypothetical protein